MEEKLYSTPEAAKELGITPGHMRTMIVTGIAKPKQRIGHNWLFTAEEIERLRGRKRRGPAKKQ
jgi:hypothetical protein